MQRPPRTGVTAAPDWARSIELLVDALPGRPAVERPRAENPPREAPHTTTHRRHQARRSRTGCDPTLDRQPEASGLGQTEDTIGFTYTNSKGQTYGLHSRTTGSSTGRSRTLYYFSKAIEGAIDDLPDGYRVVEAKTGLPLLKKTG